VDASLLKDMFKPFHTTKPAGIGMGLAVSRSLIEAHGGKLWAESNLDRGLSVHFTLPCLT
jgi:signal transduction histidine kinase